MEEVTEKSLAFMKSARQQLDILLSETPAMARTREQSAFDDVAAGQRKIVIVGAGRLGRKLLKGLSATDLKPVAFADNNPRRWGTMLDGLPVLAPQDAADRFSLEAIFVIAIWHPSRAPLIARLLEQFRKLRCRAVPFPVLFWRHPGIFLPYYFWDLPSRLLPRDADLVAAFSLLEDDVSRDTFLALVRLRLHADFDSIGAPSSAEQYFPGLFSLSPTECFVDCGAYTGDTIRSLIAESGNSFRKAIAFEADAAVLPTLQNLIEEVGDRSVLHKAAVGAHTGFVSFSGDGMGGGCITAGSGVDVPCVRLDDALARETPTFIKMDIEGAELDALEGSRSVIQRDRPVLAICGYHAPDHLSRVLSLLKDLAPDSLLFLRAHCADGLDTVCYAIPPERRAGIASGPQGTYPAMRKSGAAAGSTV